ncbi:MAG: hypothetical protein ACNA7U_08360 [Candidatus Izemoplasmataceae bacterium]|jgi:hypothetical protein|uniref:hypothetical protein n=1 Tax=Liberiplasma polymorphum TaxID=3374570 RepID=UPI0037750EA8
MEEFFYTIDPTVVIILIAAVILSILFYVFNILDYFWYILSWFLFTFGILMGLIGNYQVFAISASSAVVIFGGMLLYRKIKNH